MKVDSFTAIKVILEIEQEYNLLDYQINDVYVWQLIRAHLVYLKDTKSTAIVKQKTTSLLFNKSLWKALFFQNPFFRLKKQKVLFFGYESRSKIIDEKYQDMFFFKFMNKLNGKFDYYGYKEKFKTTNEINQSINFDLIELSSIVVSKFIVFNFTIEEKEFLKKIEIILNLKLNISINLLDLIATTSKRFIAQTNILTFLLKIKNPKRIYLINSNAFMSLMEASKRLNIKTIEFQHGAINNSHATYIFKQYNNIRYFPDKFYYFGKYWKINYPMPISDSNMHVYGSNYLELEYKKNNQNLKEDKTILITSAGSNIDKYLVEYLLKNIKDLNEYTIYYKIHPREYNKKSDKLDKLLSYNNIRLIKDDLSTHYLMSICKTHLSVGSTTIYEGFLYNCQTFILNESDLINVTEELNKSNYIVLLNKYDKLIDFINNSNIDNIDNSLFFKVGK
jgi:hypothetical protein